MVCMRSCRSHFLNFCYAPILGEVQLVFIQAVEKGQVLLPIVNQGAF